MDHAYASSTVEMNNAGFSDLKDQILNRIEDKNSDQDIRQAKAMENQSRIAPTNQAKKYVFKKADQSFELDDDFEVEFMADKRSTKMTLRELKERAAGDVAVKNRMHSLAEEKKRVNSTFKQFATLARTDPLAALEFISNRANEADSEFEYKNYIEKLAEQAEKLGQMDDKERKSWELEKKLAKAEQDLSKKEREQSVVLRKQELLSDYPEIGDQKFGQMVDAILNNDELLQGVENENDVMNRVEALIQETLVQRDIMSVIQEINPAHVNDNELIFSLSDQLRQNPDLDEQDVRDILSELIAPAREFRPQQISQEKMRDARVLSQKSRESNNLSNKWSKNSDPYDMLKQQLLEKKVEISKTPRSQR